MVPQPAAPPPAPQPPASDNQEEINISLLAVLNAFPPHLASRVLRRDVRGATLTISVQRALSQLPNGAVTITYGELRQAAPPLFVPGDDCDSTQVNLPLNEILSQINPALIARSQSQRPVEALPRDSSFETVTPAASARSVAPAASTQPLPLASQPATSTAWTEDRQRPAPARAPIAQPARPADDPAVLVTSLASLIEEWPEAMRIEITQRGLAQATVELPVATIQEGLKRGKVVLPWKMIRSWVRPTPPPVAAAYENAALELPLQVLTPLFISRHRRTPKPQPKAPVDEAIPDLFTGPSRADAPVLEAVAVGAAPATQPDGARPTLLNGGHPFSGGTEVICRADQGRTQIETPPPAPAAYETTPKEIVTRAVAMEGVAGALVALPDGLVVASKLSPGVDGDILAAFLPQFFGRLNRGTKELGMGEVNNLNFTVDEIPWNVSRVKSVIFAAFGRRNEVLPATQLAALATQLGHQH